MAESMSFRDGRDNVVVSTDRPLPMLDDPHSRLHRGTMYHCSALTSTLGDGVNFQMSLTTPDDDRPHMIIEAACGGDADLLFYEGATVSAGMIEDVPNHKRTSSNVWGGVMRVSPTVTDAGTLLSSQFMPGGSHSQAVGSAQTFGLEWVLKPSTTYLIRMTNRSGSAQRASIGCDHYSSPLIADT